MVEGDGGFFVLKVFKLLNLPVVALLLMLPSHDLLAHSVTPSCFHNNENFPM